MKGPWAPAGTLPESFAKLPADENWKDVKASLPGQKVSASQVPQVFVSFEPAELILLRGEPNYLAVQGATPLLWVSNTESDVFRMGRTGRRLLPGRGPMVLGARLHRSLDVRHADAARRLQADSARARALARARVGAGHETGGRGRPARADSADGARQQDAAGARGRLSGRRREFQPIEKTTVQRAVNTDKDIIKVGDLYYMCFQGVWFMSKTPTGPWQVTGEVPKQIYEIPVSSPSHAVTYVTVEDRRRRRSSSRRRWRSPA